MSRGDWREDIFLDDVDRYDFLQPGRLIEGRGSACGLSLEQSHMVCGRTGASPCLAPRSSTPGRPRTERGTATFLGVILAQSRRGAEVFRESLLT